MERYVQDRNLDEHAVEGSLYCTTAVPRLRHAVTKMLNASHMWESKRVRKWWRESDVEKERVGEYGAVGNYVNKHVPISQNQNWYYKLATAREAVLHFHPPPPLKRQSRKKVIKLYLRQTFSSCFPTQNGLCQRTNQQQIFDVSFTRVFKNVCVGIFYASWSVLS